MEPTTSRFYSHTSWILRSNLILLQKFSCESGKTETITIKTLNHFNKRILLSYTRPVVGDKSELLLWVVRNSLHHNFHLSYNEIRRFTRTIYSEDNSKTFHTLVKIHSSQEFKTRWGQSWRRTQSVTVNSTGCGFDSPFEEMKYLIVSFLRSVVSANRCVDIHHSTRNAFRILRKTGNRVS